MTISSAARRRLLRGRAKGLEIIAVDAPHLYDRPGNPYLGPDGKDWPDNARRFAALAAGCRGCGVREASAGAGADILHCHDWQAALAPVYVNSRGGPNGEDGDDGAQHRLPGPVPGLRLRHAGTAAAGLRHRWRRVLRQCLLPQGRACDGGPHHHGEPQLCAGNLHAGIWHGPRRAAAGTGAACSPASSTASTTRCGTRRTTRSSPQPYTAKTLAQAQLPTSARWSSASASSQGDGLLHGVVSRLTWQKGMDIFAASLDALVASGARLALIGTGEAGIEQAILAAAERHPGPHRRGARL